MKSMIYRGAFAVWCSAACAMSLAGPPPTDPPNPPPTTAVPKLLGTWSGVLYTVSDSGYFQSSPDDPQVLRITDQSGNRFRGYQSGGGGGTYLVTGVIDDDGAITIASAGNAAWFGHLKLGATGGAPRQLELRIPIPSGPRVHLCTLTKTTP